MTNFQIFMIAATLVLGALYFWRSRSADEQPAAKSLGDLEPKAKPKSVEAKKAEDDAEQAKAEQAKADTAKADADANAEDDAKAKADADAKAKADADADAEAAKAKADAEAIKTPVAESFSMPAAIKATPVTRPSTPAAKAAEPAKASVPSVKVPAAAPVAVRPPPPKAPEDSKATSPYSRMPEPKPLAVTQPPPPDVAKAEPKSEPRPAPAVAKAPEAPEAPEPAAPAPAAKKDEFDLRLEELDGKPKAAAPASVPEPKPAPVAEPKPASVPVAEPKPASAPVAAAAAPAPAPIAAAPAAAAIPATFPGRPAPSPETAELEKTEPEHAKARRFARVAVSEIKLYHEEEVKAGRAAKDLWKRLNQVIMMSIQTYEKRVPQEVRDRFDYLYDELVRQLAEGKAEVLGPDAPTSTAKAAPLKKK